MDWIVSAEGAGGSVADYERELDKLVLRHQQVTVCAYDVTRLSGTLLVQLLAAHRLAFFGGRLVESPMYEDILR
jgi:hypothetical protein